MKTIGNVGPSTSVSWFVSKIRELQLTFGTAVKMLLGLLTPILVSVPVGHFLPIRSLEGSR